MTHYILDCVQKLEANFSALTQIVLESYAESKTAADFVKDMEMLPFSLKRKYSYLFEENYNVLTESRDVKEFCIKVSSTINFLNGYDLIQHLIGKYACERDWSNIIKDISRISSCISLGDFAGLWVALVPSGSIEVTLELDNHWQYKSIEDLRSFQQQYPHKYWYFKHATITDDSICVVYAVPKSTRLYQIEQCSLKSQDVIGVHVGGEKILDFSLVSLVSTIHCLWCVSGVFLKLIALP